MKKSRFSEAQIVGILKELEAGTPATELGRRHGIHANTIRLWKEKYAGLETSDLARLKKLEAENAQMHRIIARQTIELDVVRDYIEMAQAALEKCESGGITLGEFLNIAHFAIGHLTGLIGESDVDPVRTQMNSIEAIYAWTVVEDKAIGQFKEELDQDVAAFRSELKLLNDRFPRDMAP